MTKWSCSSRNHVCHNKECIQNSTAHRVADSILLILDIERSEELWIGSLVCMDAIADALADQLRFLDHIITISWISWALRLGFPDLGKSEFSWRTEGLKRVQQGEIYLLKASKLTSEEGLDASSSCKTRSLLTADASSSSPSYRNKDYQCDKMMPTAVPFYCRSDGLAMLISNKSFCIAWIGFSRWL